MIHSISFVADFRKFVVGDEFSFKEGLNLLVGDQGSGKSSLISQIAKPDNKICTLKFDKGKFIFFDFEKNNPRVKTSADQSLPGMLFFDVSARFMSHGEVNNLIIHGSKDAKNHTVIMDEPDCALSIKSIFNLIKHFNELVEKNNQIIVAVHNPIVINSVDEVLDVENKQWIDSKQYLKNLGPEIK